MLLWCDRAHDPAENMRRDAALLAAAEAGAEPVLRLFAFAPHGITLGLSQVPERALDLAACRRDGVPWAGRPTGGRAIFHAEEWTYSLACPIDDPAWGGSLTEAYGRMTELLVASLRRLGIPAEAAARRGHRSGSGRTMEDRGASLRDLCFASTARHEVVLAGRKLAGSAQRRTARAILQQGSILLGEGHLRLADYLPVDGDGRGRMRRALAEASAAAGPWLGPDRALERWADAVAAELGPRARRLDGADAPFRLTLVKPRSYTPARLQLTQ